MGASRKRLFRQLLIHFTAPAVSKMRCKKREMRCKLIFYIVQRILESGRSAGQNLGGNPSRHAGLRRRLGVNLLQGFARFLAHSRVPVLAGGNERRDGGLCVRPEFAEGLGSVTADKGV